ncbi:MAG TPA: acyl-CoA dehydrogenase family protein [Planctomycetota bacterium]|nr:acyl-CoA dehydrogenase family protein [Planctomycetota bacterium]
MDDALGLTETQLMVRDAVREFARTKIAPRARAADEEGRFPRESFAEMAELSLTGIPVPEEYGGSGADTVSFILALEELAKVCPSTALTLAAHTSLGTMPIVGAGSEAQKRRYVPPLATGKYAGAFCLTEANIGSDVAGAETFAERKGDRYVIRGTKFYVTNATFAGSFVMSVVTDKTADKHRRLSAFVVEKGWRGIEVVKVEDKLGMRASETCVVQFDGVEAPAENRLAPEGEGFEKVFMPTLNAGRIGISAISIGIAEGAKEKALAYAKERKQFDRPLVDHQAIQFMFADMETEIHASRLMTLHAARLKDAGRDFAKAASMAKLFSAQMAMRATRNAIQILGGYGYMQEYDVERYYRDAKLCEIGEGTNEIQRIVIARHLLGRM